MSQNKKESKLVHGIAIANMKGYSTWIHCIMEDGTHVTIPLRLLFNILDKYDLEVVPNGKKLRAIGIDPAPEGGMFTEN